MSDITIEIRKSVVGDSKGGWVTLTTSTPLWINIHEAQRFRQALGDAITMAIRWQEGNVFAEPRVEPKKVESIWEQAPPPKRGRPPKTKEADDGGAVPELRGEDSLAQTS